ncbi:PREDICTED: uncharacterized protein LOC108660641 [Theobroma cacao]|uniref:Uncharacterized protein LOC108660641 n=1 Tax=Theobroma cacao TaxID=3641 RepID=A0AB32VRD8_THECC|nr:PREDICTED: uncharacterized protein LOC108660641 [Theobroma cacao]
MAAYAHDDKLLIHCFQDSLIGVAAKWYIQLDRNRIHTWKDLARVFVAQYKHVTNMALDRLSLQNMEKKPTESFKEYAQRWRNMASQVQPPLIEKETTVMFVNTLRAPYYERLVGSATKNFADMVISGEMIETTIMQGKIEGVVNNASQSPYLYPPMPNAFSNLYPYAPIQWTPYPTNIHPPTFTPVTASTTQQITPSNNHTIGESRGWRNKQEKVQFDPIPIPYAELFTQLIANHLVAPLYIEPLKPPFSRWYDASAHCDYQYGIEGHSIKNCTTFKHKVQGLIKAGILNFGKKSKYNVNNNPLPNHARAGVNAIEGEVYVKSNIWEVETPMKKVFEALVKADMLEEVQGMIDESRIEFYMEALGPAVNMMAKDFTHPMKIKPLTIFYEPRGEFVEDRTHAKMTIEVPKPFSYKDDKAVPWNYNCNVQVSNAGK